jgi:pimeloyl-ACP methyl ester carboxylesterase
MRRSAAGVDDVQGVSVRHQFVAGDNGVKLHVAIAGDGPPVVLLHGFPENWRSWQHQFVPLVEAGFSVWALDLRGYNRSARPADVASYHLRHLIADVAAVVRATGAARAHICGHDWGGVLAWTFAGMFPQQIGKLVICNAPHLEIYLRLAWRPPQLFRSLYLPFFLLPRLPELVLSAFDFSMVRRMFTRMPVRPDAFSAADVDRYVAALAAPGALSAALNYYRANRGADATGLARAARIRAETLVLWGDRDPALSPILLNGLDTVAPRLRVVRFADAGHWIQNEASAEVNRSLIAFLLEPARERK